MPRINQDYTNDGTVTGADKVIGTDAADGSTKNYTIDSIKDFTLTNGVSGTFSNPTSITVVDGIITAIS